MTTSDELAALAQEGLAKIEAAILRLLGAHPDGLRNVDIGNMLGLRWNLGGRQKDWLTYAILGRMVAQGRVAWDQPNKLFTVAALDESAPLAQEGLQTLETAILQLLEAYPDGLKNVEVGNMLGLRWNLEGRQKDWLTYAVLGKMVANELVSWNPAAKRYMKA